MSMLTILMEIIGVFFVLGLCIKLLQNENSSSVRRDNILVAMIIFSLYSLEIVIHKLSILSTFLLIPLPAITSYMIIRLSVGFMPATMRAPSNQLKRFKLIAMPINHFGEKARWCLDFLGVSYDEINVGGIISLFTRGRTVPWMIDRKSCSLIGNSDEIIMYLGAVVVPTLPQEAQNRAKFFFQRNEETMNYEKALNQFGHAIQGWAYYYFLDDNTDPKFALLAWGAFEPLVSFAERALLKYFFPVFKLLMRDGLKLRDAKLCEERLQVLRSMFDRVDESLKKSGGPFIFGEHFSYVDITFCSLAAPLLGTILLYDKKKGYYAHGRFKSFSELDLAGMPIDLLNLEKEFFARPCGQMVINTYKSHRESNVLI